MLCSLNHPCVCVYPFLRVSTKDIYYVWSFFSQIMEPLWTVNVYIKRDGNASNSYGYISINTININVRMLMLTYLPRVTSVKNVISSG